MPDSELPPDPLSYGSNANPVRLDMWHTIIEVGWPKKTGSPCNNFWGVYPLFGYTPPVLDQNDSTGYRQWVKFFESEEIPLEWIFLVWFDEHTPFPIQDDDITFPPNLKTVFPRPTWVWLGGNQMAPIASGNPFKFILRERTFGIFLTSSIRVWQLQCADGPSF